MSVDGIYDKVEEKVPFRQLSVEIEEQILYNREHGVKSPYAFCDEDAVRRCAKDHDNTTVMRSAFDRDIEKIMYVPPYNRYNDKTQVFSFLHNDDVSRRGLHVQYVSKIARNIGELLGLNTKLIEAIALGHDIGHTPFGHVGERYLDEIYYERTGNHFYHNLHSVRVLDQLYPRNLSLQTLDGILCHNGELEKIQLEPGNIKNFEEFDATVERCYRDEKTINHLVSSTLEGCVVRMADIIAYLGKDRIDALQAKAIDDLSAFDTSVMGKKNTTIINNLTVDLVENSFGKNCIMFSREMFEDMTRAKNQNYEEIYKCKAMKTDEFSKLQTAMKAVYMRCVSDLQAGDESAPIFKHHIQPLMINSYDKSEDDYLAEGHDRVVVDYIASMTDTYFMLLTKDMFKNDSEIAQFRGYFHLG